MKSVNAVLSASVAVCLCLAASCQAYDFRQLVNIPKGTAASDFCTKWGDECNTYKRSDSGSHYRSTFCELGDYQGKNKDTKALVYCLAGHTITNAIEKQTGATNAN